MKVFKDKITISKNSRGCWIIDPVKGCSGCSKDRPMGCYGDCYAKRIASRYGIDFDHPIARNFENDNQYTLFDFVNSKHEKNVLNTVKKIDMPFIRMGDMGDPSENWFHTLKVCSIVARVGIPIVIITKHWKRIDDSYLLALGDLNICINTSISALDTDSEIVYRLGEYKRLKAHCKSVLRVVTCNFNTKTIEGKYKAETQENLLKNENVIDTVFRPSKDNFYVTSGLIKTKPVHFMGSTVFASIHDDNAFLGYCSDCPDMCGVITLDSPI